MYFPRRKFELQQFLESLKHNSNEENLRILNNILQQLKTIETTVDKEVIEILQDYKHRLQNDWSESKIEPPHPPKIDAWKKKFTELHMLAHTCGCIVPNVKAYKNLYIFILSHPGNNATVGVEILSRINYLDKMSRDVTFIMPGYKRAQSHDKVVNESDPNLQLTFDENLFIDMIQDLEDKSNGRFLYNDACELVFIGLQTDGGYDFSNIQRLDLDILSKRGIDPVKLILAVAQQFRTDKNDTIEINRYVNQILGELIMHDSSPAIKVFIAGAKRLKEERSLLREELSKVENQHNLDIRSLTFEDFATSLTGADKGRQADYNKFIENEANVVVFIFDSTAGEITEEEFDIAYNSLKVNKHPDIFVYVCKRSPFLLNIFGDRRLQNIKKKIFAYQKEYYIEYDNLDNLRYLFYSDMVNHFRQN